MPKPGEALRRAYERISSLNTTPGLTPEDIEFARAAPRRALLGKLRKQAADTQAAEESRIMAREKHGAFMTRFRQGQKDRARTALERQHEQNEKRGKSLDAIHAARVAAGVKEDEAAEAEVARIEKWQAGEYGRREKAILARITATRGRLGTSAAHGTLRADYARELRKYDAAADRLREFKAGGGSTKYQNEGWEEVRDGKAVLTKAGKQRFNALKRAVSVAQQAVTATRDKLEGQGQAGRGIRQLEDLQRDLQSLYRLGPSAIPEGPGAPESKDIEIPESRSAEDILRERLVARGRRPVGSEPRHRTPMDNLRQAEAALDEQQRRTEKFREEIQRSPTSKTPAPPKLSDQQVIHQAAQELGLPVTSENRAQILKRAAQIRRRVK